MRLGVFVFLVLAQCDAATHVWAVGDGVRVNPVTGRLFEARTDIHRDYPASDPRQGNPAWNPQAKQVTLRAARNEFAAFQVIVESDDKGVHVPSRHSGG